MCASATSSCVRDGEAAPYPHGPLPSPPVAQHALQAGLDGGRDPIVPGR